MLLESIYRGSWHPIDQDMPQTEAYKAAFQRCDELLNTLSQSITPEQSEMLDALMEEKTSSVPSSASSSSILPFQPVCSWSAKYSNCCGRATIESHKISIHYNTHSPYFALLSDERIPARNASI